MSLRFDTVSFLSDYGTGDEFVGVVHSVIRSLARDVTVVDITHQVPPFDVRAGGLTLARAANHLVPGVVLAVVDPGVATHRKPVAIEVGGGQSILVGPDNGLLAPAVALVGGATAAVVLDRPEYQLERPPGAGPSTFDGRDVFAPVAAHLCRGVPLDEVGTPVDPARLVPGILPVAEDAADGGITAEVLWVDRFGNLQLNVEGDRLAAWPETVGLRFGEEERAALRVTSFAEVPDGGLGVLVDSYGLVAVVADRSSAAARLGAGPADQITVLPLEGRPARLSRPVPVALTTRPEGEETAS
ncbi:MAG: S-adenosyl-l-methionine hydroxide adenosyltransferase family protein [Acidimicrobiales bacterium]